MHVSSLLMPCHGRFKQLAAEEKDPEKVRLLIEKLIEALSEEQQQVRDDIEAPPCSLR